MPEGVIPPGKIKCFITGKLRKDKSEDRVRQDVARGLVEEYGYDKNDIDIEFPIKMGRAKKRADIVIFSETQVSHPKIKNAIVWLHASKISAIFWS